MDFWLTVAKSAVCLMLLFFGGVTASSMAEGFAEKNHNKFGINLVLTIFFLMLIVTVMWK